MTMKVVAPTIIQKVIYSRICDEMQCPQASILRGGAVENGRNQIQCVIEAMHTPAMTASACVSQGGVFLTLAKTRVVLIFQLV